MHDFQYTFRQAHQDRLEDADVIQYRPINFFRVLGRKRNKQQRQSRPLRSLFVMRRKLLTK